VDEIKVSVVANTPKSKQLTDKTFFIKVNIHYINIEWLYPELSSVKYGVLHGYKRILGF
jgi:hypothetical protein